MTWLVFRSSHRLLLGPLRRPAAHRPDRHGRPSKRPLQAFLFVGLAYLLTAVFGSLIVLAYNGASWLYPAKGVFWSTAAGIAGAIGALGVLLAFGARGTPAVVMSIVFCRCSHRQRGRRRARASARWRLGSRALALRPRHRLGRYGGCLVTFFRPGN